MAYAFAQIVGAAAIGLIALVVFAVLIGVVRFEFSVVDSRKKPRRD